MSETTGFGNGEKKELVLYIHIYISDLLLITFESYLGELPLTCNNSSTVNEQAAVEASLVFLPPLAAQLFLIPCLQARSHDPSKACKPKMLNPMFEVA